MNLSEKTIQKLKDEKISINELNDKYFCTKKDGVNVENILKLTNENICSFQEIADKLKSIYKLDSLLRDKELFEELIQNNKLNTNDARYLLNKIDKWYELRSLSENTFLLKHIVDKGIASFKELVDNFKSVYRLDLLLINKEFFEESIQNNRLNKDDLRYSLNRIDEYDELDDLRRNTPLIKYILNEFVLNKEIVDRFNRMIEDYVWCKEYNIHTIFEYIEDWNKNNKEILKLNELNRYACSFDLNEEQRLELTELLKNNEIAKNRLNQIIENHLESNYDFDSLMGYLKKKEKKNLINI